MTVRPIVITGEPVLHRRADPVTAFDEQLRTLVADMFDTMDAAHGVGLAAPQVGVGLRVFTWQMDNDDGVPARGVMVNPYVASAKPSSEPPDPHDEAEGCLSVPGESFPLKRGERASVSGFDVDGAEVAFEATGWFARCMQHEYDHLNGFLYVDRLSERWARKARKAVKKAGWGVPGASWLPGVDPDPFGHDVDEADLDPRHPHDHDL
jgi:peptide deformylase